MRNDLSSMDSNSRNNSDIDSDWKSNPDSTDQDLRSDPDFKTDLLILKKQPERPTIADQLEDSHHTDPLPNWMLKLLKKEPTYSRGNTLPIVSWGMTGWFTKTAPIYQVTLKLQRCGRILTTLWETTTPTNGKWLPAISCTVYLSMDKDYHTCQWTKIICIVLYGILWSLVQVRTWPLQRISVMFIMDLPR